jgi:hypothetical protein
MSYKNPVSYVDSPINKQIPGQRLKNRKANKGLQGISCILRHKSQFKMTVFCFLLLSDTKKTIFHVLQIRFKLDYTF